MTLLARAATLTNYLDVARQLGLNTPNLLSQAGLSASILDVPNQRIPVATIVNLLELSARIGDCQSLGLRMAEHRQLSDFGEVSLLLSYQPNLREALQVMVQYIHLFNNALAIFIEEAGKAVIIREEIITDAPMQSRQATELAVGVMFRFCAAQVGVGANWHPISVNFTHDAPADLSIHKRLFGCKLEFGSEFNGIVCHSADLDIPNPLANQAMARHARQYLDTLMVETQQSLLTDVRKAIYLLLPMGRATIEQIARTLGMNVRTLQRHLEESGATFSELINEVRRDLVMRYLQNSGYSLGHIADMLGYSMPSSFTRWFNAQFGMPPATWRTRHKIVPRVAQSARTSLAYG
ncbi:AraC family transcriptional regulator [Aeromonas eucrenophila]|uniref:AraC family transcriptional regulator n=1 Tax=Aeromonas eucrenophila TaxID=649 RepID=A0ABW0YEM5_9GAMM|nr:AraC family transcriptional regulator [Aeromonas eucrenophila]